MSEKENIFLLSFYYADKLLQSLPDEGEIQCVQDVTDPRESHQRISFPKNAWKFLPLVKQADVGHMLGEV
jgi:hypothetical protein